MTAPNDLPSPMMNHCVAKIVEIIERGDDDRRSILQLGYNLGRLSELTGLGREPFWDRWKSAVEVWNRPDLLSLVQELHHLILTTSTQIDLNEPRNTPTGLKEIGDLPESDDSDQADILS